MFIEVAIAWLVEQRVSTLCEAGLNPVIALKFFNFSNGRNFCFVNPSQVAISGIELKLLCVVRIELAC